MNLGTLVLILLTRILCHGMNENNFDPDFYDNEDRNFQLLIDYLNYDVPEYTTYKGSIDLIKPQYGNEDGSTDILQTYTIPQEKDQKEPVDSFDNMNDPETIANPLIQNIFSTIDIELDNKKRSVQREAKLLDILKSVKHLETSQEQESGTNNENFKIQSDENDILIDENSANPLTNKQKRFVISFSVPRLRFGRRRKIKGKRIRRIYKYKPFRIDPTYFLFGIGKR